MISGTHSANSSFFTDDYSEMWLEQGIAYHLYKQDTIVNLTIAKSIVFKRKELFNGLKMPLYTDISNLLYLEKDARSYFISSDASELLSAVAIYADTPLYRLMTKVSLAIDEPPYKVKIFSEEKKALIWLQKFAHLS